MIEKDFLQSLFEAPGDDEGGNDNNVDLAANNNDQNNTDAENTNDNAQDQDNNADQNAEDNQQNNNQNDQVNDDNFDIDDTADDNPPENTDTPAADDNAGDNEGSKNDISEEEKEENNEIDQIYNGLSALEKSRMDIALRNQYKELYYDIASLIQDTEKFPNTADSAEFMDRLLINLRNFKKYIVYYLNNIYDTKAHLENKVAYMQFIQIYNGIKSVYDDLRVGMAHLTDEEK